MNEPLTEENPVKSIDTDTADVDELIDSVEEDESTLDADNDNHDDNVNNVINDDSDDLNYSNHEHADEHVDEHADEHVDEHADEHVGDEDEHADEHVGDEDEYADEHDDEYVDEHADEHADEHDDEHADEHVGDEDEYADEHDDEHADEHEYADEHEDEHEDEDEDEHDDMKRSSSLSSLEEKVEALRKKARTLEKQHEISKEDMITLNITLKGMHNELEAACQKMRGTYNKQLNQCQIDVTDNLSNVVMSILTKPPKDKEAENHQVSFAKHAPALFLGQQKIHQSPTTIVLKRIFSTPKVSFARLGSSFGMYPNVPNFTAPYRSPHCPCNANTMYSPRTMMHYPSSMQYPSMPQPVMAPGYNQFVYPMMRPSYSPYSARQYPAYGGNTKKHPRTRRQRKKSQKGGGSSNEDCYQNCQRTVYDAQGQMGRMQPMNQGGQQFIFPYAVETVMAPTCYPATGPVNF